MFYVNSSCIVKKVQFPVIFGNSFYIKQKKKITKDIVKNKRRCDLVFMCICIDGICFVTVFVFEAGSLIAG